MKIKKIFVVLMAAMLIVAVNSCAGSKQTVEETPENMEPENYNEIERLLGIAPNEETGVQPEPESEVMQMLETSENSQGEVNQQEDQQVLQLQQELEELKEQLREKNKVIADLRMQLAQLESEMQQKKAMPASSSSFSALGTGEISDVEYEQRYQEAYQLFTDRQYQEAIQVFESLVAANPNHSLADNAQYWIGECYYLMGDYRAAILAFEKVFTFKNSNKNADAQYKLGLSYYKLGDRKRARLEFQTFVDNYQNSKLVRKAEQYLAKL